jgi:hypothetical protein
VLHSRIVTDPPRANTPKGERGIALLVLLTLIVLALSSILVARLGSRTQFQSELVPRHSASLAVARDGLIAWAVTHSGTLEPPDDDLDYRLLGPGLLPCPDTDDDGFPDSPCPPGTLGRLPWKFLGLTDLRDSASERLWYAISDNFRFHSGSAVAGSGPSTLVDDSQNFIALGVQVNDVVINPRDGSMGRVAAIPDNTTLTLAAPGLEGGTNNTFAVADAYFVHRPVNSESAGALEFDGQDGFVAIVLAPGPIVAGQSRGGGQLNNPANFFEEENANAADGRYVSTSVNAPFNDSAIGITANVLLSAVERRVAAELAVSMNEYRATFGRYPWHSRYAPPSGLQLTGIADGTSGLQQLEDSTASFVVNGVAPGDIVSVSNATDTSWAYVTTVTNNILTLGSLRGSALASVSVGDAYVVARYNALPTVIEGQLGIHDVGEPFATGLAVTWSLDEVDPDLDAQALSSLPSAAKPAHENHLKYSVQHSAVIGTLREPDPVTTIGAADVGSAGLVLVDASADFLVAGVASGDFLVNLTDGSAGEVLTVATNSLAVSGLAGGADDTLEVNDNYAIWHSGQCAWNTLDSVQCAATISAPAVPLVLNGEASAGSGGLTLIVTGIDFEAAGVSVNDAVVNITDGTIGQVSAVAGNQITVSNTLWSGVAQSFDAGDDVQVRIVTRDLPGFAAVGSNGNTLVYASSLEQIGFVPGDLIRNSTDGSIGVIASVSGNQLTVTGLSGGTNNDFEPFDLIQILGSHFDDSTLAERRYQFRLQLTGDGAITNPPAFNRRTRDVAYARPGTGSFDASALPLQLIEVTDLDAGANVLGRATLTVSAATPDGALLIEDLWFDWVEHQDLPRWFMANGWHALTLVSQSDSFSESGDGDCTVEVLGGTVLADSCLQVRFADGNARTDVEAVVVVAGSELAGQNRANGGVGDYFETNPDGAIPADFGNDTPDDGKFTSLRLTNGINDQLTVIAP